MAQKPVLKAGDVYSISLKFFQVALLLPGQRRGVAGIDEL
jgi:hypothetical protein